MGGEGSIAAMRISLKNNAQLLKGRKRRGYFKRELSYAEIRKYYKESTEPLTNGGDRKKQVDYEAIREKLVSERRKSLNIQVILFIVSSILVGLVIHSVITHTTTIKQRKTKIKMALPMLVSEAFENHMANGKRSLTKRNYFMAIGSYKRALRLIPNAKVAEFGLAKAYCKSCKYKNQMCQEAEYFIQEMEAKYLNQKSFTKLKERYLTLE